MCNQGFLLHTEYCIQVRGRGQRTNLQVSDIREDWPFSTSPYILLYNFVAIKVPIYLQGVVQCHFVLINVLAKDYRSRFAHLPSSIQSFLTINIIYVSFFWITKD